MEQSRIFLFEKPFNKDQIDCATGGTCDTYRVPQNDKKYSTQYFSPNTGKYGPEITPYLDTFHAVFP